MLTCLCVHMYAYVFGKFISLQGLVLAVTMLRELYDDFKRFLRDREVNSQRYYRLTQRGIHMKCNTIRTPALFLLFLCCCSGRETVTSDKIQVSDILIVEKNQRVPADIVLLHTTEKNGNGIYHSCQCRSLQN